MPDFMHAHRSDMGWGCSPTLTRHSRLRVPQAARSPLAKWDTKDWEAPDARRRSRPVP